MAYYTSPDIRATTRFYTTINKPGVTYVPLPLVVELFAPEIQLLKNKPPPPKPILPKTEDSNNESTVKERNIIGAGHASRRFAHTQPGEEERVHPRTARAHEGSK